MNAGPFEHAELAVVFIEFFYKNLLDLVGRVRHLLLLSHDECACLDTPLFPSNHHGRCSVYDAYLNLFC